MPKGVIACDIDDCLTPSVSTFQVLINYYRGTVTPPISASQITEPYGVFGSLATPEEIEYVRSVIRGGRLFKDVNAFPPIPFAIEALNKLVEGGMQLAFITSRDEYEPGMIAEDTALWLRRVGYEGDSDVIVTRKKGEACKAIGASLLIDNSLLYLEQVRRDSPITIPIMYIPEWYTEHYKWMRENQRWMLRTFKDWRMLPNLLLDWIRIYH